MSEICLQPTFDFGITGPVSSATEHLRLAEEAFDEARRRMQGTEMEMFLWRKVQWAREALKQAENAEAYTGFKFPKFSADYPRLDPFQTPWDES
jgi:hypothetical protein